MPEDIISYVLPVVLIGLIGLFVGAVSGYLLAQFLGQSPAPGNSPPKGLVEAARLWRDKRTGRLVVGMDGKFFQAPGELNERRQSVLTRIQEDLRQWLGVEDLSRRLPAAPTATAAAAPLQQPDAPAAKVGIGAAAAAATAFNLDDLPNPSPVAPSTPPPTLSAGVPPVVPALDEATVTPPSMNITDILARAITPSKGSKDIPPPASIAAQVNEIVQARLPDSPFSQRVIRVQDHPRIGLVVLVDGNQFEGVGEVSEPDVREFLRACVAEWERKSGP